MISAAWLALLGLVDARAETVDPDDSGQRWAWSPNTGWIDARPGGPGGPGLHAANGLVHGWLWSQAVGWISAHCLNTASCAQVGYGLRLEVDPEFPGFMRMVGMGWAPNAGWIMAGCHVTGSCSEVDYALRVHMDSGLVDGWAWSPNLGWISFSCANTGSCGAPSYGVQFDPALLGSVFRNGFE